jgi:hypothetical protein
MYHTRLILMGRYLTSFASATECFIMELEEELDKEMQQMPCFRK